MPVAQAWIELNHLRSELFIDRLDQLTGFLSRNKTCRRIIHYHMWSELLDLVQSAFTPRLGLGPQCDHRTAIDHIVLTDCDPQTGRFERTGTLIVFLRIVPKDGGSHEPAPRP